MSRYPRWEVGISVGAARQVAGGGTVSGRVSEGLASVCLLYCHTTATLTLLTLDIWDVCPTPGDSPGHYLGVLQFSSIPASTGLSADPAG